MQTIDASFQVGLHSELSNSIRLGHYFGGIWRSWGTTLAPLFVIIGCKGAVRSSLECQNANLYPCLMVFRRPVGTILGSLSDIFSDSRH